MPSGTLDVTVATDDRDGSRATGTTAVLVTGPLPPRWTCGAADLGTRETDLLDPSHSVQRVDVVLTGGSAYGLAAADGVMRRRARARCRDGTSRPVPIVPAAATSICLGIAAGRLFGYAAATAAGRSSRRAALYDGARLAVPWGGVGMASATRPTVLPPDSPSAHWWWPIPSARLDPAPWLRRPALPA